MGLTRRHVLAGLAGTGVGIGVLGGYAFAVEPRLGPRIQHYAFTPRRWTPGLSLRVAVLTDIHAGGPLMDLDRVEAIVDRTNALGADVIALLGDNNGGSGWSGWSALPWDDLAAALARLKAPLGVFAIQGNHEYWDDPGFRGGPDKPTAMQRAFDRHAIRVLTNEAVRLTRDGHGVHVVGIPSQIGLIGARHGRGRGIYGLHDLPRALAQATGEDPVVLLAHEPDIFATLPDRVSVQFSGHTHGGQVRMFGWSPAVPSRFGNRYAYGHVVENDRHLVVSGGLGTTSAGLAPVRLGVPPEIVLAAIG